MHICLIFIPDFTKLYVTKTFGEGMSENKCGFFTFSAFFIFFFLRCLLKTQYKPGFKYWLWLICQSPFKVHENIRGIVPMIKEATVPAC